MFDIIEKKLQLKEIEKYFEENEGVFIPTLSSKVNLHDFSKKIFNHAVQFWAIEDKKKVGFMACYFNDPKNEVGYITSISVAKQNQGKGIGKELLKKAINYGETHRFAKIILEVNINNTNAINLYKKYGFKTKDTKTKSYFMERSIN